MTRAAVDVGTNSTRLLVVGEGERPLARDMTITRLGQGVDERGHLDDEALRRTLDTIARYRERWEDLGATRVRIAATSAVRDAADRDRFFDGVREASGGIDAEVLTGEDEAATTFEGVTAALDPEPPVCVLDVGGGSTEFAVGEVDRTLSGAISLQLGCVRLTERLLRSDPPTTEELARARAEIRQRLDGAADRLPRDPSTCSTLVGVAGTVTTLAALHLGLDEYDHEAIHGAVIPCDVVFELTERLCAMPAADRRRLGPMAPGREDIIAGGALIVDATMERFGFAELVASEADILDGLIASLR